MKTQEIKNTGTMSEQRSVMMHKEMVLRLLLIGHLLVLPLLGGFIWTGSITALMV